jgi:hypothetical protein
MPQHERDVREETKKSEDSAPSSLLTTRKHLEWQRHLVFRNGSARNGKKMSHVSFSSPSTTVVGKMSAFTGLK